MYTYNDKTHVPQLRVLVTSKCNSKCVYCRPGGETFITNCEMSVEEIVSCVKALAKNGISSIKISGGDPLLRKDIVEIVRRIKAIPGITYVELITRHSDTVNYLSELDSVGLDCLNYSIDTLDPDKWAYINGRTDYKTFINTISLSNSYNFRLKLNSVMCMNDFSEIQALIDYLESIGGGTLKLLDLIGDIVTNDRICKYDFSKALSADEIIEQLDLISDNKKIIYPPGGIGHPMLQYFIGKCDVIVKSTKAGAYYHTSCKQCPHFPCYDALMALRLTPDGKLQKCLLRSDNMFDLLSNIDNSDSSQDGIKAMLNNYTEADFYTYDQIITLRKNEKN